MISTDNGTPKIFKGKGYWTLEAITLENSYLKYRKKSSIFTSMFSISVPKENIKSIDVIETNLGCLLRIKTLNGNTITSRNFSKKSINELKRLLQK